MDDWYVTVLEEIFISLVFHHADDQDYPCDHKTGEVDAQKYYPIAFVSLILALLILDNLAKVNSSCEQKLDDKFCLNLHVVDGDSDHDESEDRGQAGEYHQQIETIVDECICEVDNSRNEPTSHEKKDNVEGT